MVSLIAAILTVRRTMRVRRVAGRNLLEGFAERASAALLQQLALIVVTAVLSVSAAQAACTTSATLDMTGQVVNGTGVTLDESLNCPDVRTGLYDTSGADSLNNVPVRATGGLTPTSASFSTSKATYLVTPSASDPDPQGFFRSYTVKITSRQPGETGGADSFTMFYGPGSDVSQGIFVNATATYTVNITNLPADTPTVTSIAPTSGPAAGGTSVTITGTGFTGATAVKFGASNATGKR